MSKSEHKLIGESDCYLRVLEQASQLTQLNRPVLIVGERGTGKELIAERLHYLSARWSKPLIKMNCAAVNEALLESDLFGHEAGAFTGAARRHTGRFERVNGGTLFLDELGTMSISTQEKLLRVLEYGDFERLGGTTTLKADARLVAATNVDLPHLADRGLFRHDLLDRLAFDVITLPPLRARQEDILLLAEHFAVAMCKELGRPYFSGFGEAARRSLKNHSWPGNVRELKNAIERSVYRLENIDATIDDIQLDPFDSPYRLKPKDVQNIPANTTTQTSEQVKTPMKTGINYQEEKQRLEYDMLTRALKACRYHQRDAANFLQLSYHQFRNQLKKHQLLPSDSN